MGLGRLSQAVSQPNILGTIASICGVYVGTGYGVALASSKAARNDEWLALTGLDDNDSPVFTSHRWRCSAPKG